MGSTPIWGQHNTYCRLIRSTCTYQFVVNIQRHQHPHTQLAFLPQWLDWNDETIDGCTAQWARSHWTKIQDLQTTCNKPQSWWVVTEAIGHLWPHFHKCCNFTNFRCRLIFGIFGGKGFTEIKNTPKWKALRVDLPRVESKVWPHHDFACLKENTAGWSRPTWPSLPSAQP